MDEAAWDATMRLGRLLDRGLFPLVPIEPVRWSRKLRLWTAVALGRLSDYLPALVIQQGRELLEGLADGCLSEAEFVQAVDSFRPHAAALVGGHGNAEPRLQTEALDVLFGALVTDPVLAVNQGGLGVTIFLGSIAYESGQYGGDPYAIEYAWEVEGWSLIPPLRDIVGNPFRSVTFNPAWRTSDVLALAGGIYDELAFDRMPILADALQDAGCDSEAILSHCRDVQQTHVRGCWVVDLVLGKS
jgi:hypothetical protein